MIYHCPLCSYNEDNLGVRRQLISSCHTNEEKERRKDMRFSKVLAVIAAMFLVLTFCIGVSADSPINSGDALQ